MKTRAPWIWLAAAAWLVAGCSDQNAPSDQAHVLAGDWLVARSDDFHGSTARRGDLRCDVCHEVGAFCSECHVGPDGSRVPPGSAYEHGTFPHDAADLVAASEACDACHTLTQRYRSEPGVCHRCHEPPPAPHALGQQWLLPTAHAAAAIDGTLACLAQGCHTERVAGGGTPPACEECHRTSLPVGDATVCTSCHDAPPDLASTDPADRPRRAGAHGEHGGLTSDTGDCSACHEGRGTGELEHYDRPGSSGVDPDYPADVILLHLYDARSGAAAYDEASGTCSGVSCHGGQGTPEWLAGSLDVDLECTACHELGTAAQTPEHNSYYSGRHPTHAEAGGHADGLGFAPTCSPCHAMGAAHFAGLDSPELDDPAATLLPALGYDATGSPPTCTTSIDTCHPGDPRGWAAGVGGAPHATGQQWLLPTEHATASISGRLACLSAGCHSDTVAAGGVRPACEECHRAGLPAGDVTVCTSCHDRPPSLVSTAPADRPERRGAHGSHGDFTADTRSCDACHVGGGTGEFEHYDRPGDQGVDPAYPAEVVVLNTYDARRGAAVYDATAGTCSLVSCHGGKPTPTWLTGALEPAADCARCHELGTSPQIPEHNSYFSGRHSTHAELGGRADLLGYNPTCSACHAMGPAHFQGLDTPGLDDPVATLLPVLGYDAAASPPTCTTSVTGCHPGTRRNWTTGVVASHPVGQTWLLPAGHVASYDAASSRCFAVGCHQETGTGQVPPACSECHRLASPTSTRNCRSCHGGTTGPSGLPSTNSTALSVRPNRVGEHRRNDGSPPTHLGAAAITCDYCHLGSGSGTLGHYDRPNDQGVNPSYPAEVRFDTSRNVNMQFSPNQANCTGTCHGEGHNEQWY